MLQLDDLSFGSALQQAGQRVQSTADRASVVLRMSSCDVPVAIPMDEMTGVMTSLLAHAVKTTPAGGTVSVDTQVFGNELMVWVRDEGPGITADKVEAIFNAAALLPDATGSTTAMPAARMLVEQYGGAVWAESMPPLGTTFVLRLPLAHPRNNG